MARTDDRKVDRDVVLFVSLSGWLAGPGRSLSTLISHLPPHVQPVLACPSRGDLLDAVRSQDPRVIHVALPRRPGQQSQPWSRIQSVVVLGRWLAKNRKRIKAVHANGFSELHVAAPGVVLTRLPVVVWFHGSEENPWDRTLSKLWRPLLPARRLAAVAEVARDRAAASGIAGRGDIEIIPNPIDPKDVVALDVVPANQPCSSVVVGYLGGLRRLKGFFQLPELVERLADAPVKWAIFDRRTDEEDEAERAVWDRLEAIEGDRVRIWGRQDDVRYAYGMCDIVVALSAAESFNRVAAEAMLNRIPVVATDIDAHRALIGSDEGGLLFPLGDLTAGAEAIRRLATDASLRQKLGQAAQLRVEGPTDPRSVLGCFVEMYESFS